MRGRTEDNGNDEPREENEDEFWALVSETIEKLKTTPRKRKKTEPSGSGSSAEYWAEQPSTVQGMLGGLGHLSKHDLSGSKSFLRDLGITSLDAGVLRTALDNGAGYGAPCFNCLHVWNHARTCIAPAVPCRVLRETHMARQLHPPCLPPAPSLSHAFAIDLSSNSYLSLYN